MGKKHHTKRKKPQPKAQFPWIWLAVASAVLLVAGGLGFIWASSSPGVVTLDVTPEVVGAPRLEVDQTFVDEGYVKLDTLVRTTFRLRNVGDQPLRILDEPVVELAEGC